MTLQHRLSVVGDENDPNLDNKTPYEQLVYLLNNDQRYLKEATLNKRVGFYRIRGDLGTGNFSQVKMAVNSLTRERVAIKILDKTKMDEKTQKLLSREIKSMDYVKHPNIIRLYEVHETLAKIHIVLEYAPNGELFSKITTFGKLQETECRSNFSQIVSAVSHMHDRNIIHRDLKAENIFYSGKRIKVGDFGFSKCSQVGEQLSTYCGSPPYAAPELFKDEHYEGRYVDIWALGILLYFMVTGIMPFRADTVGKLKKCIIDGTFTIPSFVSDNCQFIIRNLLKRSPKERLTLHSLERSDWLEGQEFPKPLHSFELMAHHALHSSGTDEQQTIKCLNELGVTSKVIKECKDKGVRSNVTGIYRIMLHKLQKQKYPYLADDSTTHSSRDTSASTLSPSTIDGYSSKKKNIKTKVCTIL